MPHTSKKKRSSVGNYLVHPPARRSRRIAGRLNADFDDLDDLLVNILEFLTIKEIMCNRRVSKKWGEAIKKAVPCGDFCVNSIKNYNFMRVMATEMPNMQQLTLGNLNEGSMESSWVAHKYSDGEDPDGWWAGAAFASNRTAYDIEIISNFSKLRILTIKDTAMYDPSLLNGSYPFLFNSFPLLQKLSIDHCDYLKWDLGVLSGFPLLKELHVSGNKRLTGNIRNLRVLKDTLKTLMIASCPHVKGNLMDLADFPLLKELNLYNTAVTGDVRDIGENDFANLEQLRCPFGVVGGRGYKFQRVADAASVVSAYYRLKRRANFSLEYDYHGYPNYSWFLSDNSPDYYATEDLEPPPPHWISFVKVGSRLGWKWDSNLLRGHSCEINWLDPEPDREDNDYDAYAKKLAIIQEEINIYKGYHEPPTEEEYRRLCREYAEN
jgi:hypothetical protein